jgi:tRNA(Ile)-lysidine synthase
MRQAAGSGVVQRFLAFLRTHQLTDQTIGIAFSGGPDSTALAISAAEAARAGLLRPIAIHVNHGVRIDSADDLTMIRQSCAELGLELKTVSANLPAAASEDTMRSARYRLLQSAIAEHSGTAVMTAHHAGDQAETVLLHLIRGSGLEGLGGMAPVEKWIENAIAPGLTVIRPFLLENRADMLDLVSSRGLSVLTDPTNFERDKARNAIRLDILPELNSIHPGAGSAIARFADIVREDNDALDRIACESARQHVDGERLNVREFPAEPIAIQRRIIRRWVLRETGLDLTWNRTAALRDAIAGDRGGTIVELGEGWAARREGDVVRLAKAETADEG